MMRAAFRFPALAKWVAFLALLAYLGTTVSRAPAAIYTWNASGTGPTWSTTANWGGVSIPGSGDTGLFNAGTYSFQPSLGNSASLGGIWETGSGALTISGSALTLYGTTINSNTATGIEMDSTAGSLTINVPLVLQNGQQWINNSANPLTVNGAISGTGGLTKQGSGLMTLWGVNTFSGNLTVDGGALNMPGGNLSPSVLYVGSSGSGSFTQSGGTNATAITLYLAYSGSSSSGSYNLSGSGLLSALNEEIGNAGIGSFTQAGGTNAISSQLTLGNFGGAGGTYNLMAGGLSAFNEDIGNSGSGSFTQSGGTNTASGNLYVAFNVGSGSYNLTGGGMYAPMEYVGNSGSGSFTQSGGTNTASSDLYLAFNGVSSGSYNLSGSGLLSAPTEVIGDHGSGSFMQSGGTNVVTGTMYLAFGSSHTSGIYGLSSSGLLSTSIEYIGYLGSGSFTQSGGTNSVSGNLTLAVSSASVGTYILNGGLLALAGSGITQGAGNAAFYFGGGTLGATAPWSSLLAMTLTGSGGNGTIDTTGGNIGLSGVLSGTGGLTKTGPGVLTLGASNSYSGATNVNGGALLIGPSASIAAASAISVSNSSILAVTASTNLPGNATTIGPGSLFDTTGAGGGFSLTAGNLLTIGRPSGAGADINGNFTLGGGTLNIGGTGTAATLTESGNLTLAGGALLFDLSSTGASDLAKVTNLGISSATALDINVTSGTLSNGSYPVIDYSGSFTGNASNVTLSGLPSGAIRQSYTLVASGSSAGVLLLQVAGTSANLVWSGTPSGTWDTTTLNWSNPGAPGPDKFYNGDAVTFNDAAGNGAVTLNATLLPQGVVFNNNTLNYTLSGSGGIGGTASLTKNGSGTVTLAGNNSYSGGTTVSAGTLVVEGGNDSSYFNVQRGGTLEFLGDSINLGSGYVQALSGGVVNYQNATVNGGYLRGPGTHTTLPGSSNTFTGLTTYASTNFLQNGTDTFRNFSNGGKVANDAPLTWDGGENNIGGNLTVSSTLSTDDFINAGTITITSSGVLNNHLSDLTSGGGGQITVNAGGTLNADSQGEGVALNLQDSLLVNNGTVSGTVNVNYGATLQGSGSFSGPINLNNGGELASSTTVILSVSTLAVSSGSITGAGQLAVSATIASATVNTPVLADSLTLSGNLSGPGPLTKIGAGLLVLSGSNSYGAGTVVDAGTLEVTNNASLTVGSSLTVGAGAAQLLDPALGGASVSGEVVAVSPVPEPGTLALFFAAVCGAALYRGFRSRRMMP